MSIGFIGLGRMGEPMALNLLRSGQPLAVWNRSPEAADRLLFAGATVEATARAVLRGQAASILMLANSDAIDAVLERGTPDFKANVAGRLIIHMGTTSPEYSLELSHAVTAAGGRYVEAPVSGSRRPAEEATLVAMLAGDDASVSETRELIAPMCSDVITCGNVPAALATKLSVNVFLITMVAGLAEASHFAARLGVDFRVFRAVLDVGPMASLVSRVKLEKLASNDFSAQASITDVLMNNRLIEQAAQKAGIATPLIGECGALLEVTKDMGLGHADMISLIRGMEARTAALEARGRALSDA